MAGVAALACCVHGTPVVGWKQPPFSSTGAGGEAWWQDRHTLAKRRPIVKPKGSKFVKPKYVVRQLIILVALLLVVPTALRMTTQHAHASTGTPYYVDWRDGNDSPCNGRYQYPSPPDPTHDCPWATVNKVNTYTSCNPGDTISFADNVTWSESLPSSTNTFLHPCNGGWSTGTPIKITDYCDTYEDSNCDSNPPHPILAGNGDMATVYLYNQQGWDIENLQVTNWPTDPLCNYDPPAPTAVVASCYGQRSGVLVQAIDPGISGVLTTLNNITLQGLNVHHVLGQWGRSSPPTDPSLDTNNLTGGIIFDIETKDDSTHQYTAWSNAQVLDNTISDVWRTGLVFHSVWGGDVYPDQHCVQLALKHRGTYYPYQPSTGIQVRRNHLSNVGGNGIVVGVSTGAIISTNTLSYGDQDSGGAVAGMWTFDSSGATVTSNEVDHMADSGNGAQAFDTDWCETGDLVQYNFSYSNPSGFLLPMPQSTNNVIRYNISQDDGREYSFFLTNYNPEGGTAADNDQIYNNTIYVPAGSHYKGLVQNPSEAWTTPTNLPPVFDNNVLDVLNGNAGDLCAIPALWTSVSRNTFNGPYCGSPTPANNQHTDPLFLYPGQAGFGSSCQPPCYLPQSAYYYQTSNPQSPLMCYGAFVSGQGDDGGRDYIGVQLPPQGNSIDGGALEYLSQQC